MEDEWRDAGKITRFPRWTGYLAVFIYGPLTVACTIIALLEVEPQKEGFWFLIGWGYFGMVVGIWMVWIYDRAKAHIRKLEEKQELEWARYVKDRAEREANHVA